MSEAMTTVVEGALGREVIAFMSANHLDPDLAVEVFVLQAADERPESRTRPARGLAQPGDSASL